MLDFRKLLFMRKQETDTLGTLNLIHSHGIKQASNLPTPNASHSQTQP